MSGSNAIVAITLGYIIFGVTAIWMILFLPGKTYPRVRSFIDSKPFLVAMLLLAAAAIYCGCIRLLLISGGSCGNE